MRFAFAFMIVALAGCGGAFVSKRQILAEVRMVSQKQDVIRTDIRRITGQIDTLEKVYQGFTQQRLRDELQRIDTSYRSLPDSTFWKLFREESKKKP